MTAKEDIPRLPGAPKLQGTMATRQALTSCFQIRRALAEHADALIPALLPHAIRHGCGSSPYWVVGNIAGDRGSSMTIFGSTGTWRDFATNEGGDLLDLISASQYAGDLRKARAWAIGWLSNPDLPAGKAPQTDKEREVEDARQVAFARDLWHASRPVAGTLGQRYLKARSIPGPLPPSLRYHPAIYHPHASRTFPCLVAALSDDAGKATAVLRTYLKPDGSAKAAVDPPRMFAGRPRDCAVRLGPAGSVLAVSEGIETALSAMDIFEIPVWVSCGTSRLHKLAIPAATTKVVVYADNGLPGEAAADRARKAYAGSGRKVEVHYPPAWAGDWNSFAQGVADLIRDIGKLKLSPSELVPADSPPAAEDAGVAARRAALLEMPE
jgi:DNA primase